MGMGRVENGKIVNHSGVARPCLNGQELHVLVQAMDCYLYENREFKDGAYYEGLLGLRRKLKRNLKRTASRGRPLVEKKTLFVKPKDSE
jgi:hypothetical protein